MSLTRFRSSLLVAGSLLALAPIACATSISSPGTTGGGGDDTTSATTSTSGTPPPPPAGGGGGGRPPPPPPGPCTSAADCAAFSDECNDGACINGVCGTLAKNENGACSDGKTCTQNDSCHDGVCVGGTQMPCTSSSPCMVATCDVATDQCVEVPGNDGASCVDNDPCTLSGVCQGGVCQPGQLTDCSFLDGVCSQGTCDPQLGCVAEPLNDGTPCDDGFFCTVNDVCGNAVCAGVPNTCAAPGDVCMVGTCDEVANTCVAVPGNNGGACNDGNPCTANETCSNGACVGGVPANNGMACDDGDGCTGGTTCSNGNCTNATSQILACVDNDSCCPNGCAIGADNDCAICHDIGYASCPTQATQFCSPDPISPTSAVQAKLACDTCYGFSCYLETADCAGQGYGPSPPGSYVCGDPYWGFEAGCSGDAGRVWSICGSFTTYGYWGN